ncbi:hypothetical protein CHS0354_002647 [Potamilus streckersoni]|uniref:BTB domain-containing protein n=1 Tax=Potamilus streckersoni TaxID=2493646 RepID=A0AAE0W5L5_9BIVA|nr:hypothetical protein CHS0354_002647 [Potamilus streckersoni]
MTSSKKIKFDSQESGKSSEDMGYLQDIDFTKKSRWTDLHLKVEDKELYVPKSHLALVSPVFRLMFESYFKEKYLDVLPLPGKKYGDVLTFLKCTHPGSLVKVTCKLCKNHMWSIAWKM